MFPTAPIISLTTICKILLLFCFQKNSFRGYYCTYQEKETVLTERIIPIIMSSTPSLFWHFFQTRHHLPIPQYLQPVWTSPPYWAWQYFCCSFGSQMGVSTTSPLTFSRPWHSKGRSINRRTVVFMFEFFLLQTIVNPPHEGCPIYKAD